MGILPKMKLSTGFLFLQLTGFFKFKPKKRKMIF